MTFPRGIAGSAKQGEKTDRLRALGRDAGQSEGNYRGDISRCTCPTFPRV
jgi:hypothetical protein